METGLILVTVGDAANSVLPAMGQVLRAMGRHLKIGIITTLPADWRRCMEKFTVPLKDSVHIYELSKDETPDTLREEWETATKSITSDHYGMVILQNISILVKKNAITTDQLVEMLRKRPASLHVIIADSDPGQAVLEESDMITEMRTLKG
ncbi:ATP--corrinoid adenosyltransferase [Desulfomonile tiedjei]|uniref:corrinoid adenosyltransferase n=1 Tax=Desulfomonile tiedjei (strain ATCC 49306 / DSM 6799 / DCB-1) TaxID=706587 RepID=I4C367_DESTA|nr:ATP--corrinoid adenosyltransferase [Desulfomonile tiedjei]AFM24008.1 ATP:corrinoid adenosyltransferase [Desulfomonile tiedjei DSM 6799]